MAHKDHQDDVVQGGAIIEGPVSAPVLKNTFYLGEYALL